MGGHETRPTPLPTGRDLRHMPIEEARPRHRAMMRGNLWEYEVEKSLETAAEYRTRIEYALSETRRILDNMDQL